MTSVRNYKHGGKATEVNDMYEKQNDHGATMIDEKIWAKPWLLASYDCKSMALYIKRQQYRCEL